MYEQVPRIALQGAQVVRITGVSQLVEIDDGFINTGQPVQYKVGADEAGAAGNENHVGPCKFANVTRIRTADILRESP